MSSKLEKYTFLLKPLFFISSLLFASWLVLKIEKLRPSDFGEERYLFENEPVPSVAKYDEQYLKNLFLEYKFGIINSRQLDEKLEFFLKPIQNANVKKN
ncbi:MAG: hypothetical protein K8R85_14250 [Bacteroidetes bacterium]|nr:hypothetical protein [Bacteroidota bacterium]